MFLLKGNAKDCIAIIKAHFAFYGSINKTLKKRKNNFSHPQFKPNNKLIAKTNIVFDYYLKGKKKFNEMGKLF